MDTYSADELPIHYVPGERLLVVLMRGILTLERFGKATQAIWTHPHYADTSRILFDLTLLEPTFYPQDLVRMRQSARQSPHYFRGRAALVTRTPIQTALALLYNMDLNEGTIADTFTTWEAATAFLGVNLDSILHLRP